MDDIINGFQDLKISALSKSKLINDQIKDITIGPNRTILLDETCKSTFSGTSPSSEKKSSPKKKNFSPRNESASSLRKIIQDLEKERQEKVYEAVSARKNVFDDFAKQQEVERKEQWLQQQQKIIENMEQQEALILDALEQYDRNVSNQHQQLVQYYQNLANKQKKNAEELEAREKRNAMINSIVENIKKDQAEFRLTFQEISSILKSHSTNETLRTYLLPDIASQLGALPGKMNEIIASCRAGQITENEMKKASETLAALKAVKEQIQNIIAYCEATKEEAAKQEAARQAAAKQEEAARAAAAAAQEKLQEMAAAQAKAVPENKPAEIVEAVTAAPSVLEQYCSRANLKRLSELQDFLSNYRQSYKQFTEDAALKQYRFNLKKAVNIPVNAISAVNSKHLLDKYDRLHNLLVGKPVIVGETQITATKHPQAIAFCMDLVAEKLVLQGDLLISSNPEAAFNYAAVLVALWNDFPDFGKLVLAHFYEVCPYLVPWYVPRTADQTTEEYYKNQGYKYTDGVPEKQDKFLKRMTGIMRLYSAIFITKPKRGQNQNPHGMAEAWRWIGSILNLEPRLDITATMIHVFLETVGFSMQTVYGKMFQKVMRFIREKYMPMIEKIDSGGPFTRLSVLFDKYAAKQILEPPGGILPSSFW